MDAVENFLNEPLDSIKEREFIRKHNSKELYCFLIKESFFEKLKKLLKNIL
jgi:hypothetical protein